MSYPNYNATAAADTQVNLAPITETTVATDPLSGTTYGMYGGSAHLCYWVGVYGSGFVNAGTAYGTPPGAGHDQ